MHAKELKVGMRVEYHNEVVEVDPIGNRITIENPLDHARDVVFCDELEEEPQLHIGCHHYY